MTRRLFAIACKSADLSRLLAQSLAVVEARRAVEAAEFEITADRPCGYTLSDKAWAELEAQWRKP